MSTIADFQPVVTTAFQYARLDCQELLNVIADFVFLLSKEGIVLDYYYPENINPFTDTAFNLGKHINDLVPKDFAQQMLQATAVICSTGKGVTFEAVLRFNNITSCYEIRMAAAKASTVVALVRNITERKLLEEQLSTVQNMESLQHMAGGIAHEFNNLLTVIQGFAGLAELHVESHQTYLYKALNQILFASEKGRQLTNHLLSFAGKQVIKPQLLDLGLVFFELQTVLRPRLKDSVELQIEPTAEPMPVKIAASQLKEIFSILAINANEAMPNGGVLQIRSRYIMVSGNPERNSDSSQLGQYVMIEVTDSGSGIEPAFVHKIFDPFFTTKQTTNQFGLGLSICHGIVQQNGGRIMVKSIPQVGTTFKIFLPSVQDLPSSSAATLILHSGRNQANTLLVEDDTHPHRAQPL